MKRIVLTGGGTAGHVTPNMALVPKLEADGYKISYIGSKDGMEKKLIKDIHLPYYGISSGKLRRYFDLKNFSDPLKVVKGYFDAKKILKKVKPDVVFSKGGFVTVPVVFAAKRLHIPVIIHESDLTPGLANKLSIPKASKVCCNFPETIKHLPAGKAVLTGSPIREELFQGDASKGLSLCGFTPDKPVLLIIGGSLGSVAINNAVRRNLDNLLSSYQVIHLCGKGNLDPDLNDKEGYQQFDYVKDELKHYFACASVVVSRAGANAICELLALRKPHVLIPLGLEASRGDQILNAKSFEKQGYSYVLQEEDVTSTTLTDAVNYVHDHHDEYVATMEQSKQANPIETIINLANSLI